jgi:hypothetical protein
MKNATCIPINYYDAQLLKAREIGERAECNGSEVMRYLVQTGLDFLESHPFKDDRDLQHSILYCELQLCRNAFDDRRLGASGPTDLANLPRTRKKKARARK